MIHYSKTFIEKQSYNDSFHIKQLPMNLYQIQTKFRDEIRPRLGLLRCKELHNERRLIHSMIHQNL